MLKGRHPCDCQATKHDLVNNCVRCGKIVCAQEGSGPCLFCDALVCTKQEQEVLNRGSKKSEQLRKKLLAADEGKDKAEAQKNKLLEFDRNSEKRTKVIDDESDYFSVDAYKWMNEEQRKKFKAKEEEMRAKKHASKLDRKLTFDFAGRRVIETDKVDEIFDESVLVSKGRDPEALLNPYLNIPPPKLIQSNDWFDSLPVQKKAGSSSRLQDKELQEMSDQGMCLSMHQPWASYLVKGIKIHEGRTWYSSHRGRLWIHAASKEPTEQEVKDLQNFYRIHYKSKVANARFPKILDFTFFQGSCLFLRIYQLVVCWDV